MMKFKFSYMLRWLGVHRYKIIDSTYGFGSIGTIKKIKCKICGIEKTESG